MLDIICIEDEEVFRENLIQILETEGYKVKGFADGSEVIDYLQESNPTPNLIICDINLPRISGYEFLRRISEMGENISTIPVIYLTAMGQQQDIDKGRALKVNDYLVKPVDFDLLLSKVKILLR